MNKKAAERYMSPWLFLVWALIAAVIVAGVLIIYSAEGDVREIETDILVTKIVDCIVDSGELNQDFLEESFDIFQECHLNKEILNDSKDFYFNISIKDKAGKIIKSFSAGEKDFEIQCELEGEHSAECSRKKVYALKENKERVSIEILVGSANLGRRI